MRHHSLAEIAEDIDNVYMTGRLASKKGRENINKEVIDGGGIIDQTHLDTWAYVYRGKIPNRKDKESGFYYLMLRP